MSRWLNQFNQHGFHGTWNQIVAIAMEIHRLKGGNIEVIREIRRLKKVVSYLKEIIDSCDLEVVPKRVWDNFHNPINNCLVHLNNYSSNRSLGELQQANTYLDEATPIVQPYYIVSGKSVKSAQASYREYSKTISDSTIELRKKVDGFSAEVLEAHNQLKELVSKSEEASEHIENLKDEYFTDKEDRTSLKSRFDEIITNLEENKNKFDEYYDELFEGTSQKKSLRDKIQEFTNTAKQNSDEIVNYLKASDEELTEFRQLYIDVFGDDEGSKLGLEAEFKKKLKAYDDLTIKHRSRYEAFERQIESLIPGATSAGLASAYHEWTEKFEKPIKFYSNVFYTAVTMLFLVATFFAIHKIQLPTFELVKLDSFTTSFFVTRIVIIVVLVLLAAWLYLKKILPHSSKTSEVILDEYVLYIWGFRVSVFLAVATVGSLIISNVAGGALEFVSINDFLALGSNSLIKAPLFIPIIWLAIFASKRRSEMQRLQQEYAHKEALAKSYQSFKQQIQELDIGNEGLLKDLLSITIQTIGYNASVTLDGKHGDKVPVQELLEKTIPNALK